MIDHLVYKLDDLTDDEIAVVERSRREMTHTANASVRVDDAALVEVIGTARRQLVFIAPGVRKQVAEALAQALEIVPANAVYLVLDVDAEVCRLGYGSITGLELLQRAAEQRGLTLNLD